MTTRPGSFLLAAAVLLPGCDQLPESFRSEPIRTERIEGRLRQTENRSEQVRVWKDRDTGCQYLLWETRRRGGITPRLTSDGRPMCRPG